MTKNGLAVSTLDLCLGGKSGWIQEGCEQPLLPMGLSLMLIHNTYQNKAEILISSEHLWQSPSTCPELKQGKRKGYCLLFLQNLKRNVKQLR